MSLMGRVSLIVFFSAVGFGSTMADSSNQMDKKSSQLDDDRSALMQKNVFVHTHQAVKYDKTRNMPHNTSFFQTLDGLKNHTIRFGTDSHNCSDTLRQSQGVAKAELIVAVQKAFQCFHQAMQDFTPTVVMTASAIAEEGAQTLTGEASKILKAKEADTINAAEKLADVVKWRNADVQQDWNKSTTVCAKWNLALGEFENAAAHFSGAIGAMSPMNSDPDLMKVINMFIDKQPKYAKEYSHDAMRHIADTTHLIEELTPAVLVSFKDAVVFVSKGAVCNGDRPHVAPHGREFSAWALIICLCILCIACSCAGLVFMKMRSD